MFTCAQVGERLPEYSLGFLELAEKSQVEEHLRDCLACRRELQCLATVEQLVETHGLRTPPPGLFHAVRARIESGEVRQDRRPWWMPAWEWSRVTSHNPWVRGMAMAGAMSVMMIGFLLPTPTPSTPEVTLHPQRGGRVTSALASSIRQHALSSGGGSLTDRVAWEATAQLAELPASRTRLRRSE